MCPCGHSPKVGGAVGIDGGISAGNRILGELKHMEDRSVYCAFIDKQKIYLPPEHNPWPTLK